MGRCPVRLHQLPAVGPGTSDTAARPGRSVAAGNILEVGQASSLGAWRVLHGHLPGKPDARRSARSASGCTIPHHDSTPDQLAGRTPCASPTAGKFTEAIAGSAAKSQRGGHFGLCRRPIQSGPLHGVRDRHHAPITSICAAIPFNRWPLPEIQIGGNVASVLADHGLCSSGRSGGPGGSGASHAASQKGWRTLRVHRHSAARVSVTHPSAACIRRSPRRRKGPRSTARMVAGTSGCSRGIPGAW